MCDPANSFSLEISRYRLQKWLDIYLAYHRLIGGNGCYWVPHHLNFFMFENMP
jgi:hypothetical protein